MRYVCLICGAQFPYLRAWYQHLLSQHPELEPLWAKNLRLALGRKPRLWAVLEDARSEGLVAVIREKGVRGGG